MRFSKRTNKLLNCLTAALFLTGLLLIEHVFAQDPTATEGVRAQQARDQYRIEQQIQQVTAPLPSVRIMSPQLPPTDIEGQSQQKIFKLNHVVFDPLPRSIPQRELEAITDKYIAMGQVSMYDLYCMVVEIDGLFDRRHILGRAGLPVQDVENGAVTVQIIEGRESQRSITITAPPCLGFGKNPGFSFRPLDKYFVQQQFRFSGQRSFNIRALEDEILRYNRTFRSQLVAEIEPGEDLGQCTLKLTRILPQPVSGGCYVDNSGRESSGRIRTGVYMNLTDILGLNDSFFVSYDKTDGTSGLYIQGEIPVSRFGTFADMSYYYGVPKTISGPFAILDINGTSEQYRPGFRQILVNGKERRLDATLHYQNYHSETFFGEYLNYVEKHDAITVGLEYSKRQKKSATFAGISVVTGHAETYDPIPEGFIGSDFCLMKMNLMKVWYPNPKWTFILRGNGNAALSDLPQSQVFQIGGMATVRGTPESMMSGESGYLITAEARYLLWGDCSRACCQNGCNPDPCCFIQQNFAGNRFGKFWKKHSRGEVFTFIDHGGLFYRNPAHSADFISTIGTGATVQLGKHCSLSGGFGQPIFTACSHLDAYRQLLKHGNAFFTAKVMF